MRSTTVKLLRVKPLPASAFPALRLPPSTAPKKPISNATSLPSTSAKPTSANVAAELQKKVVSGQELGSNVRVSKHINNRDLYWKVSLLAQAVLLNAVQSVRIADDFMLLIVGKTGLETTTGRSQEALARSITFY